MLIVAHGFLAATIAIHLIVIGRRYARLPARVPLNIDLHGRPVGTWPRPFIWLPVAIVIAVDAIPLVVPLSQRDVKPLSVLVIELGAIDLALALFFSDLMDVMVG